MLKGIKVLELAGLGPVPMCGHLLKDYGANVTRILNPHAPFVDHLLGSEKVSISLDLRNKADNQKMAELCASADILLDPYRLSCLDRLGFSPSTVHKLNRNLILCRVTGYGNLGDQRSKDYYLRPGHDINYLAETGILWLFTGETCTRPIPPANLIADMAGGAFPAALGIVMALYEREKTGLGKIVDVSIADGISYVSTHFLASRQVVDQKKSSSSFTSVLWPNISKQCANLLDGGAPFYRTYKTKDNNHIAVGAVEPHFYANLLKFLGVPLSSAPQLDRHAWPRIAATLGSIFANETRNYWITQTDLMQSACISPVWSPEEALRNRPAHTLRPMNFSVSPLSGARNGTFSIQIPAPCPLLSDFPTEDEC